MRIINLPALQLLCYNANYVSLYLLVLFWLLASIKLAQYRGMLIDIFDDKLDKCHLQMQMSL